MPIPNDPFIAQPFPGVPGRDVTVLRVKTLPTGKRVSFTIRKLTFLDASGCWKTLDVLEPFYTDCGCTPGSIDDVYCCLFRECGKIVCSSHCLTCQACGLTCCSQHVKAAFVNGARVILCDDCTAPKWKKRLRKLVGFFVR